MNMTEKNKNGRTGLPKMKPLLPGLIILICAGIILLFLFSEPKQNLKTGGTTGSPKRMPVTIQLTPVGSYPAKITALGEIVPRYRTVIRSRVEGEIDFLSDSLRTGKIVRKGEVLVSIEKSRYRVQVAEAKSRLKTSRITLLTEEREAKEAEKNWKRSGIKGKPSSKLVLRHPQLDAARAELKAAEAGLESAKIQLAYTDIKSPYDGVVMKRSVNPGETLFAGDEVAVVYSLEAVETGIHLDADQWHLLKSPVETTIARLKEPGGETAWSANVVRVSRHLERETRLRSLFLAVKAPLSQTPPLLPGAFVRAELTGRMINGLLSVPETALTKEGIIWFIDKENRLESHRTEPVFYGEGRVYIINPTPEQREVKVAVSPNSGFTSGLMVQPLEAMEEDR